MDASFRFDKAQHKYYVGDRELISVTTLLKAMGLQWYPNTEAVHLKMELGTYVHQITEFYDKNRLGYPVKFYPENIYKNDAIRKENGLHEALPYFEAYKKFLKDTECEIIEVEKRYYHPAWGYAGTIDNLVRLNGQLGILDKKTGIAIPATELQLGGYGEMYRHWNGIMPKGFVLYLQKDGNYKLKEVPEMPFQSNTFLSALSLHKWKQKNNIKEVYDYERNKHSRKHYLS